MQQSIVNRGFAVVLPMRRRRREERKKQEKNKICMSNTQKVHDTYNLIQIKRYSIARIRFLLVLMQKNANTNNSADYKIKIQ
jgi:hypothetical protein